MINLNNKYVIGTHIMFFEIEMYKDFIDGMVNLLETVENKENVGRIQNWNVCLENAKGKFLIFLFSYFVELYKFHKLLKKKIILVKINQQKAKFGD